MQSISYKSMIRLASLGSAGFAIAAIGVAYLKSNQVKINNLYTYYKLQFIDKKLNTIAFNTVVYQQAKWIENEISKELTSKAEYVGDKAVEQLEKKASSTIIRTISQVVAHQLNLDGDCVEYIAEQTIKPQLRKLISRARPGLAQLGHHIWSKSTQLLSRIGKQTQMPAYTYVALGEVFALEQEKNKVLNTICQSAKKEIQNDFYQNSNLSRKGYFSTDPFHVGFLTAINHCFLNCLKPFIQLVIYLNEDESFCSEEKAYFEKVTFVLKNEKTTDQTSNPDYEEVKQLLGLSHLSESRYHHDFLPAMQTLTKSKQWVEAAQAKYQEVKNNVKEDIRSGQLVSDNANAVNDRQFW